MPSPVVVVHKSVAAWGSEAVTPGHLVSVKRASSAVLLYSLVLGSRLNFLHKRQTQFSTSIPAISIEWMDGGVISHLFLF